MASSRCQSFLPCSRGTSGGREVFAVVSEAPLGFATHYFGRSCLCAGQTCVGCAAGAVRQEYVAAIGANVNGIVHLLILRDNEHNRRILSLGAVVESEPWKRGKMARWNVVKTVSIPTDELWDLSSIVYQVVHLYLPSRGIPESLGLLWQEKMREALNAECSSLLKTTTFSFE